MRNSFTAPLILIAIGALFLANNLNPELSPWRLLATYWPYLLISWGAIRLLEIGWLASQNLPLPKRGISGGEWALIIFITFIGVGTSVGMEARERFRTGNIRFGGLDLFQESFEYPVQAELKTGKTPRIIVENRRGDIRLVGGDSDLITVSGQTRITASSQERADEVSQRVRLELSGQENEVVLRTNQEKASGDERVESYLEVRIPRGATVECRGTRGDFDVQKIEGGLTVVSDNAGVRGEDIGGAVKVQLRRSDIVRLQRVKGSVDVRADRGDELQLEDIGGEAAMEGGFRGDIDVRRVGGKMRFTSERTKLTVDGLRGRMRMSDGNLEVDDVTGPVSLRSRSKDVRISGYRAALEVDLERGDIELQPGTKTPPAVVARTSSGAVTLHLPDGAKFQMEAVTRRGEIENHYGEPLRLLEEERGGTITGGTGGALQKLESNRGRVTVTRGSGVSLSEAVPPLPPLAPKPPTLVER